MSKSERDWSRLQNVVSLLLILVFCLYLPSLSHYIFADDEIYLAYSNRFLREADWTELYQLLLGPKNPWEFLPVRDFTYWLDFRLFGDESTGFHATNLFWYAASGFASFLMFKEVIALFRPELAGKTRIFALCGALIFVAHPAHVEVVAWIASRKDLLAATFGFFSIAMLARSIRRGWRDGEMLLAAALLLLACFSKAAAMTNILVVVSLFGIGWNRSPSVNRTKKLGYLFLFTVLIALVFIVHLKVGEASGIRIENHPGWLVILDRASRILTVLTGIVLLPYPLRFYYDVYEIGQWHWIVTASAMIILALSISALSNRRPLWAFGVVLTISPLLVYLQLMPFTTWSLASERFVFVSVAGLAFVAIDFFSRLASPVKLGGLLILFVVPSALLVWARVGDWEDGRRMLVREYSLQPHFHNAIRDKIVLTLLPNKQFEEAATLARSLERSYATNGLLSLIATEQAYLWMRDVRSSGASEEVAASRQSFCNSVSKLQFAIRDGYEQMPTEPDVSYNNILRILGRQLHYQYGDSQSMCATSDLSPVAVTN